MFWLEIWKKKKNYILIKRVGASLVAQSVNNPSAMQETWVQYLCWENSMEKGMVFSRQVFLPEESHRGAWCTTVHGIAKYWKERKKESEVAQSCPSLCYHMDCSLPGSSVHGIFQARVLEWAAISLVREYSQPRDWTRVSRNVAFTIWAT